LLTSLKNPKISPVTRLKKRAFRDEVKKRRARKEK